MLSQAEIRQEITQKVIAGLRNGVIPWRKPWRGIHDPVRVPTNFTTKRRYSGINILSLQLAGQIKNYPASYWATFQQWKSVGCSVRKNEKATGIVLWKPVKSTQKKENGEKVETSFPIMKSWSVFNIAQVDGDVAKQFQAVDSSTVTCFYDVNRNEFDHAVVATGADIRHGYELAAYHRPPSDYIVMPNEDRFEDFPTYAETLLHELSHYSEHRLGWTGSYGEGELRAEMSACFLSSALGIPNSDDLTNHTAYISHWLNALENDPKFLFKATAAASKATDYILSFSLPKEESVIDELASIC